jgi:hypothetical protein
MKDVFMASERAITEQNKLALLEPPSTNFREIDTLGYEIGHAGDFGRPT